MSYTMLYRFLLSLVVYLLSASAVMAITYELPPPGSHLVGESYWVFAEPGETLKQIGDRYEIGIDEMVRANLHVLPYRVKPWSKIVIPAAFLLPHAPRKGIVINLPELRLFYFPPGENVVMTYPIGIGREGWLTPTMKTRVAEKIEGPFWYPPDSIKEYMATKGVELPDVMPPGPENPLGDFAMRLGRPDYLIHGTNRPESVGKRSSSGCIRMLPRDVEELFHKVKQGTPVVIVNQPYKSGWHAGDLYLEVHKPFEDNPPPVYPGEIDSLQWSLKNSIGDDVNYLIWDDIHKIVRKAQGYPVTIDHQMRW